MNWKGYEWMNGQPWGVAHPNKNHTWWCDETETSIKRILSLKSSNYMEKEKA